MSRVKYLKSGVDPSHYPEPSRPEIAVVGRSNAGKSSFINALTKSKIAHVSKQPGKTRLLSFFDVGEHYRLVDMPGYGFASRSGDEIRSWQVMIETYLSSRENLVGLLLVMDVRRPWTKDESMLLRFMNHNSLPVKVLLTKTDKCSQKERAQFLKEKKRDSHTKEVYLVSSTEGDGVGEIEELVFNEWIKAKDDIEE